MTTCPAATLSDLAHRFADTYTLRAIDPHFGDLFADRVEIRHNYEDDVLELPGAQFATVMLRMLQATQQVLQDASDECTALVIGDDGFTMAVTCSGILEGGVPVRIPRCLIAAVADGRIVGISEFGDRSQRAALDEALSAAGRYRT